VAPFAKIIRDRSLQTRQETLSAQNRSVLVMLTAVCVSFVLRHCTSDLEIKMSPATPVSLALRMVLSLCLTGWRWSMEIFARAARWTSGEIARSCATETNCRVAELNRVRCNVSARRDAHARTVLAGGHARPRGQWVHFATVQTAHKQLMAHDVKLSGLVGEDHIRCQGS
jgi:hypothetical protein